MKEAREGSAVRQKLSILVGFMVAMLLAMGVASAQEYFTVVVLPDTQVYSRTYPEIFKYQTDWIVRNVESYNIRLVLHAGDVVDSGAGDELEWQSAKVAIDVLDAAGIPTVIAVGNHDYDDLAQTRSSQMFNTYFGVERYVGKAWFGGSFEAGKSENMYALLDVDGTDYLIVNLEFGPRDHVLDWANGVIENHPDAKAIILTHSYMHDDGMRTGESAEWNPKGYGLGGDANDGEDVWHKLVKRHKNIDLVLSGHTLGTGVARRVDIGDHGNFVHQVLANYQMKTNGGDGFLRLLKFHRDGRIEVETYSPYAWENKTDADNQFVISNQNLAVIDGTVQNSASRQALGRVHVTLEDARGKVIAAGMSDGDGRYALVAPEGCYVLRAQLTGFEETAALITTPNAARCSAATVSLEPIAGFVVWDGSPYIWEFEDEADMSGVTNDNTGATFEFSQAVQGDGELVLAVIPSGTAPETKIAAPFEGMKIARWNSGTELVIKVYLPPENNLIPERFFVGMADITTDWAWVDGLFSLTEAQPGWNEVRVALPAKMRNLNVHGKYTLFLSFMTDDKTPLTEAFYVDTIWVE